MFYVRNLHFEEGNKGFELDKRFGFVNEQQFALQDDWNEGAMYQKLCHVAMKHDIPVEGNGKGETQDMNAHFGKNTIFDFEVSPVKETIPSQRNVSNPWIGNGNSRMDAVSQANDTDKTQLSNGHCKQPKIIIWKIEPISNLIHGMEE